MLLRRRLPSISCGVFIGCLIICICLLDHLGILTLEITSQMNDRSAVYKLLPLRYVGEKRAEYENLGCFNLSQLQLLNMKIQNRSIDKSSPDLCMSHCTQNSFMYSYYKPLEKVCMCDNIFLTRGLAQLPCSAANSTNSTQVYITAQVSKIKYKKMSEEWDQSNCTCADDGCTELLCNIYKSDNVCWVGPSAERLRLAVNNTCSGYQLVAAIPYNSVKTYCVPDMYGFLPTFSCDPWKHKPLDQVRLYYIKSIQVTVKVPLKPRRDQNQSKVLLVAYYRSGSTFLSEFFSGHPDSYYLYEPLHGLTSAIRYRAHEGPNNVIYGNRTIELLDRAYRCQFDGIPLSCLDFSIHKLDSFFKACKSTAPYARISCLLSHQSSCLSSQLITIKAIRVKLGWTEALVRDPRHQNLKIVLLLRDPRGLYNSRRLVPVSSKTYNEDHKSRIQVYCQSLVEDYNAAVRLANLGYGHQLLIVRYEDLAENKMAAAQNIYKSLSLGEMPESLKNHLEELSQPKSSKMNYYGTSRADSIATAYKWKSVLPYNLVKELDQVCNEAYKIFGYLPVESPEQLKNFSNLHKTIAGWL